MIVKENIVTKALGMVPDHLKMKAGEKAYEGFIALRRKLLDAEAKEAFIDKDHVISYWEVDRGKDETMLFLHGFADSKDTFYDAAQFLVGEYNLVVPDLPGFGKSFKKKSERYSLENFGRWILKFIEDIGLTGFHLVGNSLGGAVAIRLAAEAPEHVKTVTLVDPAGVYIPEPYNLHHELFDGHIIFDIQNRDAFEYFLNRVFVKQPIMPHPIRDFIYKEFSRHNVWYRKLLADLFAGLRSEDDPQLMNIALNHCLEDIKSPTLIIWGDEDSFFPKETAYLMKSIISNSEIHFLMDVGHAPQIEVPRRFTHVLRKFIKKQCLLFDAHEKQRQHSIGSNVSRGFDVKPHKSAAKTPTVSKIEPLPELKDKQKPADQKNSLTNQDSRKKSAKKNVKPISAGKKAKAKKKPKSSKKK